MTCNLLFLSPLFNLYFHKILLTTIVLSDFHLVFELIYRFTSIFKFKNGSPSRPHNELYSIHL